MPPACTLSVQHVFSPMIIIHSSRKELSWPPRGVRQVDSLLPRACAQGSGDSEAAVPAPSARPLAELLLGALDAALQFSRVEDSQEDESSERDEFKAVAAAVAEGLLKLLVAGAAADGGENGSGLEPADAVRVRVFKNLVPTVLLLCLSVQTMSRSVMSSRSAASSHGSAVFCSLCQPALSATQVIASATAYRLRDCHSCCTADCILSRCSHG